LAGAASLRIVSRRLLDRQRVLYAGRPEMPHVQLDARGGRPRGGPLPAAGTHDAPP